MIIKKRHINIRKRTNSRIRRYFNCRKKCILLILLLHKKNCLSLHYNEANYYFFVNGTEIYKFKAKDSKNVASPLSLGNISNNWSVDNMKKTGFTGYFYDFSVDHDAIPVDDIKDICK